MHPLLLALPASLILAACADDPVGDTALPDPEAEIGEPSPAPRPDPVSRGEAAIIAPDCSSLRALPLTPDAARGEAGARHVLLEWARALENRQWNRAWCQFGDNGGASGQIFEEFARDWAARGSIDVYVPTGKMKAAAGSSYYTAPAKVTVRGGDGALRVLMGDVILRRVNDVPGASAEELRWHVASARLTELPEP